MCNVWFSWELSPESDAVTEIVHYRTDTSPERDYGQSVVNSPGIILKRPSDMVADGASPNDHSCSLFLSCNSATKTLFDAVDVICNARHLEIYSSTGEYIATADGIRVDEVLNCPRPAYMIPCSFDEPMSSCKLKFVSLEAQDELWVHSVHITQSNDIVSSADHFLNNLTTTDRPQIDMNKVKSIVASMGNQSLTPKAQALMDAVEIQQRRQEAAVGAFAQSPFAGMLTSMFMNMAVGSNSAATVSGAIQSRVTLELPSNSSLSPQSNSVSDYVPSEPVANSQPDISLNTTEDKPAAADCSCDSFRCSTCGRSVSLQLRELESRLRVHIDSVEKRMTSRLLMELGCMESRLAKKLEKMSSCLTDQRSSSGVIDLD